MQRERLEFPLRLAGVSGLAARRVDLGEEHAQAAVELKRVAAAGAHDAAGLALFQIAQLRPARSERAEEEQRDAPLEGNARGVGSGADTRRFAACTPTL